MKILVDLPAYYGWIRLQYSLDNDSHILTMVCADRIIRLKQSAASLFLGESFIRLGSTSTLLPLTIIIYCWLVGPPHCGLSGSRLPSTALMSLTWTSQAVLHGGGIGLQRVWRAGCRLQVRVAGHCFTITETTQTFAKMLTSGLNIIFWALC